MQLGLLFTVSRKAETDALFYSLGKRREKKKKLRARHRNDVT